jgi:hypothetical protein
MPCIVPFVAWGICGGHPGPGIPVWDHHMDVMHCRLIRPISPVYSTNGGFGQALAQMAASTYAAGGTDLLLRKVRHDWSEVFGVAYNCAYRKRTPTTVISVKY